MKLFLCGLVLVSSWAAAVEGTVWYNSDGEVAVVEGAAAEPLAEPFVPESRKRELARRERQGAYQSSVYDNWHSYGHRPYYGGYYHRNRGGWYGGWNNCYRPVHYSGGIYGSYRSTSGRFSASFRSGGYSSGTRIGVTIR